MFLFCTNWATEKSVTLGWLHKALSEFHRQDDLKSELVEITKIAKTSFTLIPHKHTLSTPDRQRVVFNSLQLECLESQAETTKAALAMAMMSNRENNTITQKMQFIPHTPTPHITQHQLQLFAQNQSHYASNITWIKIKGFTNIDQMITDKEGTNTALQKHLISTLDPNTKTAV